MSRPYNKQLEQDILDVMLEYQRRTGFNMTLREIATQLGYSSVSWLPSIMNRLEAGGYIARHGNQSHAIERERK